MSENRLNSIRELIKENPNLSGNKIYQLSKERKISIRKTNFYEILREVRELSEPTLEKQLKSIPIKYRIPKQVLKPDKKGLYGIVEIKDKETDNSFWIKYTTNKDYRSQLSNLEAEYNLKEFSVIFHGFHKYASFIAQEFRELLESENISLE